MRIRVLERHRLGGMFASAGRLAGCVLTVVCMCFCASDTTFLFF